MGALSFHASGGVVTASLFKDACPTFAMVNQVGDMELDSSRRYGPVARLWRFLSHDRSTLVI